MIDPTGGRLRAGLLASHLDVHPPTDPVSDGEPAASGDRHDPRCLGTHLGAEVALPREAAPRGRSGSRRPISAIGVLAGGGGAPVAAAGRPLGCCRGAGLGRGCAARGAGRHRAPTPAGLPSAVQQLVAAETLASTDGHLREWGLRAVAVVGIDGRRSLSCPQRVPAAGHRRDPWGHSSPVASGMTAPRPLLPPPDPLPCGVTVEIDRTPSVEPPGSPPPIVPCGRWAYRPTDAP